MKIVYCIQGLWKTGGIERVVTTKANYWVQHGHQVWIVTTDQGDRSLAFPLDDRVERIDLGLNYEADNSLGRWKRTLALYRKRAIHKELLSKVLHGIKPDITVSTFFQDAPILPNIHDGSKKVLELHSAKRTKVLMYPSEKWFYRFWGELRVYQEERLSKRYDAFVILTEEERELWNGQANLSVIPNPCSFVPNDSEMLREKRVVALGRFEYQKNFSELINIWAQLDGQYDNWELCLYGAGPYEYSLKQQIESLGLSDSVKLKPIENDVETLLRTSSIYVLTSHYEGLPMVLIEAQTCGLPIVSYDCASGPRDIITDGLDGYIVEYGNRSMFVNRLLGLMGNRALWQKMSIYGVMNSNRYSLPTIMTQWEQLFSSLVK